MNLVLAALFLLGVVLAAARWAGRADFVVRYHDGRFTCQGRLARQNEVAGFLREDLGLRGPVWIAGRRLNGRLLLRFGGGLTPGQRQRIRNFLLSHR